MTPPSQLRLLERTFFSRMFESEVIPSELPQTQIVFTAITLLAGPAFALPILLARKYINVGDRRVIDAFMAQDRTLVLVLAMLATAMVTLVVWEKLFPDRRDCRALGVLPIAPNTFVLARLAAIVTLFALLFAGSTALWSVMLGGTHSIFGAAGGPVRNMAAQFVSMAGLEAAVFFGIIGVQCVIVITAGPALARRLAVLMQMLLVVIALQLPMLLPGGDAFVSDAGAAPQWTQSATLWPLPPLWFLAVHERIATGGHAEARAAVWIATGCATLLPLLALLLYAASYGRLTRLAIEGRPPSASSERSVRQRGATVVAWVARVPATAAVCLFTMRTLARSQQHRMLLAVWGGAAVALSISSLVPLFISSDVGWLERPRSAILVIPLIYIALMQTGMRMLFSLPAEMKGNWAFRLREPLRLEAAVAGASAAMTICGVLPGVLIALLSVSPFWGLEAGIKHALFCGVLGALLVQILLRGFDRIPFTCTYSPGKARVTDFWAGYLVAFSAFTYGMAALSADLLRSPLAYAVVTPMFAGAAAVLWWMRHTASKQLTGLRFRDEPDDLLTVLSL